MFEGMKGDSHYYLILNQDLDAKPANQISNDYTLS